MSLCADWRGFMTRNQPLPLTHRWGRMLLARLRRRGTLKTLWSDTFSSGKAGRARSFTFAFQTIPRSTFTLFVCFGRLSLFSVPFYIFLEITSNRVNRVTDRPASCTTLVTHLLLLYPMKPHLNLDRMWGPLLNPFKPYVYSVYLFLVSFEK